LLDKKFISLSISLEHLASAVRYFLFYSWSRTDETYWIRNVSVI